MLNMIKGIINQKKDFLEAAELILEDGLRNNLDDMIILDEKPFTENEEIDTDVITEDDNDEVEEKDNKDDSSEDSESNKVDTTNMMDEPIDDQPDPSSDENNSIDLLDEPIEDDPTSPNIDNPVSNNEPVIDDNPIPEEQPLPLPGDNSLPEPVSNVTGEPVADDGLTSMEIDLGTNTPKDILPVPPSNAGDTVVSDDLLDQRIDSGFGGNGVAEDAGSNPVSTTIPTTIDDGGDLWNESIEDDEDDKKSKEVDESKDDDLLNTPIEESNDLLNEAISLSGDNSSEAESDPNGDAAIDALNGETPTEAPPVEEEVPADNTVTAAVKDKVAEAETPTESSPEVSKDEIMKKLSNITKNLEDAKNAVMKHIQ